MPAESLRELIIQDIEATLATIVAGATYHHTVKTVIRGDQYEDDLSEYPACMVVGLESTEDDTRFSDRQQVTLSFTVFGVLSQWEDLHRDTSRLGDDIKRAILADWKRSGYAQDTHVTRTTPFILGDMETEPKAGVAVEGNIQYRHLRGDPYTQA